VNISAIFINRPIGTSLLAVALFLSGVVTWPLLPVAPLPQVDFPTIQVSSSLPGASPETMASNVATPLERFFSLMGGLSQMTSNSFLGSTSITLQFDLNRNIDAAAVDVQAAINAASGQLPTNLPGPPTYRKINPADCCRYRTTPTASSPSRFPKFRGSVRSAFSVSKNRHSASSSIRRNCRVSVWAWKMCGRSWSAPLSTPPRVPLTAKSRTLRFTSTTRFSRLPRGTM
jgi:hypothetical protein